MERRIVGDAHSLAVKGTETAEDSAPVRALAAVCRSGLDCTPLGGYCGGLAFRADAAALSTEEAIAYAQRGRGKRKRPTTGWASLTPAEREVVRLVSEGLANNDIAGGFSSPHAPWSPTSRTSAPNLALARAS